MRGLTEAGTPAATGDRAVENGARRRALLRWIGLVALIGCASACSSVVSPRPTQGRALSARGQPVGLGRSPGQTTSTSDADPGGSVGGSDVPAPPPNLPSPVSRPASGGILPTTTTGPPDGTPPGYFWTSGNQIMGPDGRPVLLRGMMLPGLEASPTNAGITAQVVAQAHQWGANFIRVPLGEQFWLSSNCDYSPSYVSTVDQVVNWITSLHMVALLDLHYNTVGGCEVGAQHNMPDEAQSPEFWQEVASRYASNPYVAFDLYNEPHNVSDAIWLNGGTTTDVYAPNQTYQAAGMQQLYDVVRSTGAKNLVFVSGTYWSNDVPQTLVSGFNIVYAPHVYTCPGSPPPNCSNKDPYDPSQILDNWLPIAPSVPIVVTEFGWPSTSSGTYNSNVIAFAAAHGWGWSANSWNPGSGQWTLANWTAGIAYPTQSGEPILQALGGSP